MPKVSIILPIHNMQNGAFFLWRAVNSILEQTFKDYEIIITKDGKMATNTNQAIKRARGELVKILYMDDYFAHKNSLQEIVDYFINTTNEWVITGCDNNPLPYWTDDIETGNNKLGSPSCLSFRNEFENNLLFDEEMSFLLDCDYYKRMYEKHGLPKILKGKNVIMGIGEHQMSNILTVEEKEKEFKYMKNKYAI